MRDVAEVKEELRGYIITSRRRIKGMRRIQTAIKKNQRQFKIAYPYNEPNNIVYLRQAYEERLGVKFPRNLVKASVWFLKEAKELNALDSNPGTYRKGYFIDRARSIRFFEVGIKIYEQYSKILQDRLNELNEHS